MHTYIDSGNQILIQKEAESIEEIENDEKIAEVEIEAVIEKESSADEEGLIAPFKLRACDEIIDRKSRRRRHFEDGEEVINPFMRSMPY